LTTALFLPKSHVFTKKKEPFIFHKRSQQQLKIHTGSTANFLTREDSSRDLLGEFHKDSPLFSTKEPYISRNEPYTNVENVIVNESLDYRAVSAKMPSTYAEEPLISRKRALYLHKRAMKDCSRNDSKCIRYACYDTAPFIHRFFRKRALYFCKRTMKVCSRYNSESLMHDKVFIRKVTT